MAMALRPRESPTSMASRCTAQALADDSGGAEVGGSAGAAPKSVVTAMAGFAPTGLALTPATAPAMVAAPVVPSAFGRASQEPAGVANSAPKSVVTSMAGFAGVGPPSAPVAVADGRSATGSLEGVDDPCPHKPGDRTPTPASSNRRPPFPGGRPWPSECA